MQKIDAYFAERGVERPRYRGELPEGNDGLGLMLLGVTGDKVLPAEVYADIKKDTITRVRGTVQADILKEDQAQNTCIFSTEFSLKLMGDVQEYFTHNNVRNFYSVSISGYHIAEAGANPISQLAFTLANGFTYVEYYLSRGLAIDSFAPNLSFFFSNGSDPEYAVMGRVARRIWAKAMKNEYKGDARSQMLKYHVQTSGRSLHAQEISFNDIRTTLQALYAIFDNCNSLHTNAYDEAITTPTEESVRRAMAIQLIINHEFGLAKNQNPLQGSFIIELLTQMVEDAVLAEFDRISDRGGVLGAMETMYQRGKIQEESLYYETQKHTGGIADHRREHVSVRAGFAHEYSDGSHSLTDRRKRWADWSCGGGTSAARGRWRRSVAAIAAGGRAERECVCRADGDDEALHAGRHQQSAFCRGWPISSQHVAERTSRIRAAVREPFASPHFSWRHLMEAGRGCRLFQEDAGARHRQRTGGWPQGVRKAWCALNPGSVSGRQPPSDAEINEPAHSVHSHAPDMATF